MPVLYQMVGIVIQLKEIKIHKTYIAPRNKSEEICVFEIQDRRTIYIILISGG